MSVTRRDFLKHATFLTAVVSLSGLPGCGPLIRRKPLATAASKTVADVDGSAIRKFATGLHGRVILPADPDYESARHVWNWAVDKHPGMIARCADSTDVVRGVDFARNNDLPIAVRAGGHGVSANASDPVQPRCVADRAFVTKQCSVWFR